MTEIGTHRVETSESGRVTIITGEALQAEHASNLRMVVSSQVDNIRQRVWAMHHEARELKSILTQERTPMGFNKYDLKRMIETLDSAIQGNIPGKASN